MGKCDGLCDSRRHCNCCEPAPKLTIKQWFNKQLDKALGIDWSAGEFHDKYARLETEDAKRNSDRYEWLAAYLIGEREDKDDAIIACKTEYELSYVIDQARAEDATTQNCF